MVNQKRKGTNAERELVHLFWATPGWVACRIASSGAIKYPCPDLLAANNLRKLAIECKSSKEENQYISEKQVSELKVFAQKFGAEAWVGIRFSGGEWYFVTVEDLKRTKSHYVVRKTQAKQMAFTFKELVNNRGSTE